MDSGESKAPGIMLISLQQLHSSYMIINEKSTTFHVAVSS